MKTYYRIRLTAITSEWCGHTKHRTMSGVETCWKSIKHPLIKKELYRFPERIIIPYIQKEI